MDVDAGDVLKRHVACKETMLKRRNRGLSGGAKHKLKDKDIRKAENLKHIPKIGSFFTSVNCCSAKAANATSNDDSSASDISSPV